MQGTRANGTTKNPNIWSRFYFFSWNNPVCLFQIANIHSVQKKQKYCEHIIFFVPDNCLNFCLQNIQSKLHRGFERLASMLKTSQDACAEKIKSISVGG